MPATPLVALPCLGYTTAMPQHYKPSARKLCLVHANCQGDPLVSLLRLSPGFSAKYDIVKYTNYTRESIPPEQLAQADVFLYQPLDDSWQDIATATLLARIGPQTRPLELPNLFFKGYWPFWQPNGKLDFADSFLDHLAESGISHAEALHVCLHTPLEKVYDLQAVYEDCLNRERAKQRTALIGTSDMLAALWRSEQLFTTINHPGPRLLVTLADAVLETLGFSPLGRQAENQCPLCDDQFELPIHPRVGAFFGLPFATPHRRYAVCGKKLTYTQYAAAYLDCRLRGIDTLMGYLHAVEL